MAIKRSYINFILYLFIGGGAAVIDYGTFFIFEKNVPSITPEIASLIGQAIGFLFSFFLNTFINFKKKDKLFKRFLSYLCVTIIGMVISTFVIMQFKEQMNVLVLKFITLVGVSMIQFALNKIITYNKI